MTLSPHPVGDLLYGGSTSGRLLVSGRHTSRRRPCPTTSLSLTRFRVSALCRTTRTSLDVYQVPTIVHSKFRSSPSSTPTSHSVPESVTFSRLRSARRPDSRNKILMFYVLGLSLSLNGFQCVIYSPVVSTPTSGRYDYGCNLPSLPRLLTLVGV